MSTAQPQTLPDQIEPMLATLGEPSAVAGRAVEFKWDGIRGISYTGGSALRLLSRSGRDITCSYPELSSLPDLVSGRRVVLDGELVALDDAGRPSFSRLQQRMQIAQPSAELIARVPAHYVVFDLLHLDGATTIDLPYGRRRDLLADLGLVEGPVMVPPHFVDRDPAAVMVAAQAQGLEGIVIKRLDSVYQPGRRSRDWIKVPINHTQEVVIIGYKPGQGRRAGTIGSLMLAVAGPGEQLSFAGGVGTGFTDQMLDFLRDLLAPLTRSTAPVPGIPRELSRGARWVEPRYVGEVTYRNWTDEGHLRHCSWRGLRPDKSLAQTVPVPVSTASVELSMRSLDQQWLVEVIRVGPITYCRITHGEDVLDWIPDIEQVQAILDREHVSLADLEVVPNGSQPLAPIAGVHGRTATG